MALRTWENLNNNTLQQQQEKDDDLEEFVGLGNMPAAKVETPAEPPTEDPVEAPKEAPNVPPKKPAEPAAPKDQKKVEKPKGTGRKSKVPKGMGIRAISKAERSTEDVAKLSVYISGSLDLQLRIARGYTKINFSDLVEESLSGFLNNTYRCPHCDLRFTIQGDAAPCRCPVCGGEKLEYEHFLP